MDPTPLLLAAGKALGFAAGKALDFSVEKKLDQVLARHDNDSKVNQAWRGIMDDAVFEVQAQARALDARVEALENKPVGVVDEEEAARLIFRVLPEVAAELVAERRRMLAAALAGLLRFDMEAVIRSKVSRVIMQLEPTEVLELRKLVEDWNTPERKDVTRPSPERFALLYAGCVAYTQGSEPRSFWVTDLGKAVLATLREWAPKN